jgi:hypothetical protein
VRSVLVGLAGYVAYAAIVGVLFTHVVVGLVDAPSKQATVSLPVLPMPKTSDASADRRELLHTGSSAPVIVTLTTVTNGGVFDVECHTTADRASSDALFVDPGEIAQIYKELGCH